MGSPNRVRLTNIQHPIIYAINQAGHQHWPDLVQAVMISVLAVGALGFPCRARRAGRLRGIMEMPGYPGKPSELENADTTAGAYGSPCAAATAGCVIFPPITLMPPRMAGCRWQAPARPRSASDSR